MNIVLNIETANRRIDMTPQRRIDNQERGRRFQFLRSAAFRHPDAKFLTATVVYGWKQYSCEKRGGGRKKQNRDPYSVACSHTASSSYSGMSRL